jgi:anhydro-N-acetylmuramic acid kinase
MKEYQAIGIMSGSSLDGLDICAVKFTYESKQWSFSFLASEVFPFSDSLLAQLQKVRALSGLELTQLDMELGTWIGQKVNHLIKTNDLTIDVIGSHGHTVFHQIDERFSLQIGNGQVIAQSTDIPVVADFRLQNILLGGQGAPLVPIGDWHLFHDFDIYINLGGIANVTIKREDQLMAGDVVPCNQVLNALSTRLGFSYDDKGRFARQGKLLEDWLNALKANNFYKQALPKSISNEWIHNTYLQNLPDADTKDLLHSFSTFIAHEITDLIPDQHPQKVLVTGGGAYNDFLIDLIQKQRPLARITVPPSQLIDFKEALIFALMAVLKLENLPNCLASYTGAKKDLSTGVVFFP